jgi:hypothetical protein
MSSVNPTSYDDLIAMVNEFRNNHRNLPTEELNRLVLRTFKINRAILRDIDGVTDNIHFRNNGA